MAALRRLRRGSTLWKCIALVVTLFLVHEYIFQTSFSSLGSGVDISVIQFKNATMEMDGMSKHPSPTNLIDEDTKFILYYTKYWDRPDFQFGMGREPFLDYNCPVHNCWADSFALPSANLPKPKHSPQSLSRNKTASISLQHSPSLLPDLGDYDAVMFSIQANDGLVLSDPGFQKELKSWRQAHQRFVFVMMESQSYYIHGIHHPAYKKHAFFNWTMTFKWNSDIPRPYGWFQPKLKTGLSATAPNDLSYALPPPREWIAYDERAFLQTLPSRPASFRALATNRTGKVAWIVSHCHTDSLREDYVHQLKRYIQVDEFGGKCNKTSPPCDQSYSIGRQDNCTQHVEQHYKFYLAFENTFCNSYVTEKFFRRMEHSLVIVLGQANYTHLAPPHSHLNILDFDSVKSLADRLHQLDQNHTEYLSYFWWQDHYNVIHPYRTPGKHKRSSTAINAPSTSFNGTTPMNNFGPSMCHLCAKLHNEDTKEASRDDNSTRRNTSTTTTYTDMYQWWRESAECGKTLPALKARLANDPALPGHHHFKPSNDYSAARSMGPFQPKSDLSTRKSSGT